MTDEPGEKIRRLMRQSLPDTGNVADFAAAARKRGRPVARPLQRIERVEISGNNNQVHIHIHTTGDDA